MRVDVFRMADTKEVTWAKPEEYKMYEKAKKELEKQQDKAARKQVPALPSASPWLSASFSSRFPP
jgi:hypothetical protein